MTKRTYTNKPERGTEISYTRTISISHEGMKTENVTSKISMTDGHSPMYVYLENGDCLKFWKAN